MLRVSEFSRLGRVTVKALHLYDRLGLLEPARVDPWTGYRLYTLDQLPRLNRVLALKDLGFSLDEVRGLLDKDPSPAELRGMLRLKRAELERQLAEGQDRLARVEARLRQIEREGAPPAYDIALKPVEPMTVASARAVQPTHESFIRLSVEVENLIQRSGVRAAGPTLTLFYDEEFRECELDVEVAVPVASGTRLDIPVSGGGCVRVRELEGLPRTAYLIWRSDGEPLVEAYTVIGSWIADSGYRVSGPAREIYLCCGGAGPDVFEIQYPVEEP